MKVPFSLYEKLVPTGFVKPEIKNEKYYLRWSETSFGIHPDEEGAFREFLDKSYRYILEMLDHVEQFNRAAREKSGKERYDIEERISPVFELRGSAREAGAFKLVMSWDAIPFIEKEESIWVPHQKEDGLFHSQMQIRWDLGELYAKALIDRGD